eukprot:gene3807-biopygen2269
MRARVEESIKSYIPYREYREFPIGDSLGGGIPPSLHFMVRLPAGACSPLWAAARHAVRTSATQSIPASHRLHGSEVFGSVAQLDRVRNIYIKRGSMIGVGGTSPHTGLYRGYIFPAWGGSLLVRPVLCECQSVSHNASKITEKYTAFGDVRCSFWPVGAWPVPKSNTSNSSDASQESSSGFAGASSIPEWRFSACPKVARSLRKSIFGPLAVPGPTQQTAVPGAAQASVETGNYQVAHFPGACGALHVWGRGSKSKRAAGTGKHVALDSQHPHLPGLCQAQGAWARPRAFRDIGGVGFV